MLVCLASACAQCGSCQQRFPTSDVRGYGFAAVAPADGSIGRIELDLGVLEFGFGKKSLTFEFFYKRLCSRADSAERSEVCFTLNPFAESGRLPVIGKRKVEKTRLGRTHIEVTRLCIGCMRASGLASSDNARFVTTVRHASDMGLNFLDTAAAYGDGYSEELVSKAIAGHRHEVVIASKFNFNQSHLMACVLVWSNLCGAYVQITSICLSPRSRSR